MLELKFDINESEKTSNLSFKLIDNKKKIGINSDILSFYDYGDFFIKILDTSKFYLNTNHGFGEFEIVNEKYIHHIIISLDDIIIVSDLYKETDGTIKSKITRFNNYNGWRFVKELIIEIEKNKETIEKYIDLSVYNKKEQEKLKKKFYKKIKKIKKILSSFPLYAIE